MYTTIRVGPLVAGSEIRSSTNLERFVCGGMLTYFPTMLPFRFTVITHKTVVVELFAIAMARCRRGKFSKATTHLGTAQSSVVGARRGFNVSASCSTMPLRIDVLQCDQCGGVMRIVAAIHPPERNQEDSGLSRSSQRRRLWPTSCPGRYSHFDQSSGSLLKLRAQP
jgi:hypothetical protein